MKIVGLIIVFLGIILFELPGMIKQKLWKETAVFSGLLAVGMVLSFAAALNIQIPSPTKYVNMAFGPVSKFILSLLK